MSLDLKVKCPKCGLWMRQTIINYNCKKYHGTFPVRALVCSGCNFEGLDGKDYDRGMNSLKHRLI